MDDPELKQFLTRLHDVLEDLNDFFAYKPRGYIQKASGSAHKLQIEVQELYEQKGYSIDELKFLSKSPETRSLLIEDQTQSGSKSTGNRLF